MKKLMLALPVAAALATAFAQEPAPAAETPANETKTEELSAEDKADQAAELEESDDSGFWFEAGVDVLSDYMWRGVILNDNWCWQPSVSFGYNTEDLGGIYFNYWGSYDFTHRRNSIPGGGNSRMRGGVQEDDFYLGYTKSFGDFDFELGWYWYEYPNNGKYTGHCAGHLGCDLYAGVFYNNDYVTPGVELLWACLNNHGHEPATAYVRFSAKHEFELCDSLTLTPKATLGVGDTAFVQNNTGNVRSNAGAHTEMTDQTSSLTLTYKVCDNFSLGVSANYTWIPSHTLRKDRYMTCGHDSRNQLFWGGFNATVSF